MIPAIGSVSSIAPSLPALAILLILVAHHSAAILYLTCMCRSLVEVDYVRLARAKIITHIVVIWGLCPGLVGRLGWLRWQVVASPLTLDHDIVAVSAICLGPASTFVKRLGVSLLMSAMRRVKQLVEVEVLQNLSRLLLVLLGFVLDVGCLAAPLPLVRAYALAHETVLVACALKLCVLYQVLKAVIASTTFRSLVTIAASSDP